MAITAMGMIKKINKIVTVNYCVISLLPIVFSPMSVLAGEWQLKPILTLNETYTDNLELSTIDTTSSFVTQTTAGLNADFKSNLTSLNLSGSQTYASYSKNSKLNNDFQTLTANGQYDFGDSGLVLTATGNIANVSRNSANNSLADIVSGDTVQTKTYSAGLNYNIGNSSYLINSSVNYNTNRSEDNIAEYDGINVQFNSENGNTARSIYWQLDSAYTKRDQLSTNNEGENSTVDALLGVITSWDLNPFIRYYDEKVKGTGVTRDIDTTSSWGPGLRWLATPHIIIDLSYNFVADDTVSDDYFDTSVEWEPSGRTSLTIGYTQRFFGDSYNFNFNHRTKRLTNSITYDESLEVFDRNSYQEDTTGNLELVNSNDYALNKRLSWSSQLQLSRTSFNLSISSNERTYLETDTVNDTLDVSIGATRTISPKSNLSITAEYNYSIYDKDNPTGSGQEDYYRTFSVQYTKKLALALSSHFTIRHVNRDSSVDNYTYDEVRAIINITKEF